MSRAPPAALIYFALVFAAGFALGTIRTLALAPALGETGAVALELPLMLGLSWLACGFAIRRSGIGAGTVERLAMGVVAFALLMLAETLTGTLLIGRSLPGQLATYRTLPAQLGLAAQIAFAAFPLIRMRT